MSLVNRTILRLTVTTLLFNTLCSQAQESAPLASAQDPVLKRILARHELRVLSVAEPQLSELPRAQTPAQFELMMLDGLADYLKVRLKMIYLNNVSALIPMLLDGQGDMIAANLTITAQRKRWINFSAPIATVYEELVVRKNSPLMQFSDLKQRTICFELGTMYYDSLQKLKKMYPQMRLKTVPLLYDTEALLAQVGKGKVNCIIADSNYIAAYHQYRDDIKTLYRLPWKQQIGWGIQKNATALRKRVDSYLKNNLPHYRLRGGTGDLPQIKQRRVIRVLTRNNPRSYFIHRGQLMGFEYELVKKFADQFKLQVVMVVPPQWNDLIPWLKQGYGDIIAAGMTITPKRQREPGIVFASSYGSFSEGIITRANDRTIKDIFSLKNRTFVVRQHSSYWETLQQLQRKQLGFKLIAVPNNMETDQILEKVAQGKYDLTMADDNIFAFAQANTGKLKLAMRIGSPLSYGWVVRQSNPLLKNAIRNFFKREYRGVFYNLLYRKYYTNVTTTEKHKHQFKLKSRQQYAISPFDNIIKKYSAYHQMPWCLIASQIYQESRFDPNSQAWDGGIGLMQLMPGTIRELGCKDPYSAESNINAGVTYMAKLRDYTEYNVSPGNRVCFALASYNGGYGHLRDARKLAAEHGLNPDVWRNNVEKAYWLLTEQRYSSRARYGSCRADIITKYVNEILIRFQNYLIEVKKFEAQQKAKK